MIPTSYRPYLWLLAGLNIAVAVFLYFRMPESPRWLEARGRRDEARQVMERLEARVMKRHPVLPEPDLAPYEVVAEEKTSMFVVFGKQYLWTTILLLVVMAMGYAGIVYGGASYGFLFLSESRGYSAGFVFALTAWAGVVATVAYIINAIIGDRVERKYTQLVGAILFAGSWYLLYVTHHNTPLIVVLYIVQNIGIVLWLWEHVHLHSQQLPDPDALARHRLDRRYGPPRGLGRRAALRAALRRHRAAELDPVHHDSGRARPRRPDRGFRGPPAPPRAGRNGPLDRGRPTWAARSIPRCLRRSSPRRAGLPPKLAGGRRGPCQWPGTGTGRTGQHRAGTGTGIR